MPGETFTSRKCTPPCGVDDAVGPAEVGEPEHLVGDDAEAGCLQRSLLADPGGDVELGRPRGVAGRVVVGTVQRLDLHGRQRLRPVAGVDDRHGEFDARRRSAR